MTAEEVGFTNPPETCMGQSRNPRHVGRNPFGGSPTTRCANAPEAWDGYDLKWLCGDHLHGAARRRANEARKASR